MASAGPWGQMLAVTESVLGKDPHFCPHHCLYREAKKIKMEFLTFQSTSTFNLNTVFFCGP